MGSEPMGDHLLEDDDEANRARRDGQSGHGTPKLSQDLELIAIAEAHTELFLAPDDTGWAAIEMDGRREVQRLGSAGFRQWLIQHYLGANGRAPRAEALSQAVTTLEAKARYAGRKETVFLRTGAASGKLYLDLCDPAWRVIEIDEEGWRIVDRPPVYFRRRRGMLPLPEPQSGGHIAELRPFLNLAREDDFILVVAWLIAALRPSGPYPILTLSGEAGSAKTTMARFLWNLIDPNFSGLRSTPREERDLWIAASNAGILGLDNLSSISIPLSDALCRIATGGGFATRQLHSDDSEMLFDVVRPVILTSIGDVITQSDLADRALTIELPAISDEHRRDETSLHAAFAEAWPRILGALLDAVVFGLRNKAAPKPKKLPRLADFALWASACEGAFAEPGTVLAALQQNISEAIESVIEADPVCVAVLKFLEAEHDHWRGPGDQLLLHVKPWAPEGAARERSWPSNPQQLSNRLRLAQPVLRRLGVMIRRGKSGGKRFIELQRQ
jgi:hypothetical protein